MEIYNVGEDGALVRNEAPPRTVLNSLSSELFSSALSHYNSWSESGVIESLEESIKGNRLSLQIRRSPDPAILYNLALGLWDRYQQLKILDDLDESISFNRQALALRDPGDPQRMMCFRNLAVTTGERFKKTGSTDDLNESADCRRHFLQLCPRGHPLRNMVLEGLAITDLDLYAVNGRMEDVQEAILCRTELCELSPDIASYAAGLAIAIQCRYEQTGDLEDLEEAIQYHRKSVELTPADHPDRPDALTNVANDISKRFHRTHNMEDLESAIQYHRQCLQLRPLGHHHRVTSLNNLSVCLLARSQRTKNGDDMDEATVLNRECVDICPIGHPMRHTFITNLATLILHHPKTSVEGLDESVDLYRQSLEICPPNGPDYGLTLSKLAESILERSKKTGISDDLEYAAQLISEAESSLPPMHPMHSRFRRQLAMVNIQRYDLDRSRKDLYTAAFDLLRSAAGHLSSSLNERFEVCLIWANAARHFAHDSSLEAHSTALALINRICVQQPTLDSQHNSLASSIEIPKSLASDAASRAIEMGELGTAVEMLEQGRALLWSKLRGYRHPLIELREFHPELAESFEGLSGRLEIFALANDNLLSEGAVPFDIQHRNYRRLSKEWDEVVDQIRQLDGFHDFLQTVPFSKLRQAAAEGPVIVVNISSYRSDAIIVRFEDDPILVPLPDASPDALASLTAHFTDPRASTSPDFSKGMAKILRQLWELIVRPVTEELAKAAVKRKSRIWWCPTSELCALPLHAAGPYMPGEINAPDLYVWSYTSTLSTLITARANMARDVVVPRMIVIGQPDDSLPTVEEEIRRVQKLGPFVDTLIGDEATRKTVISGLQSHSWAHFACHGHRDPQPFHSSFKLSAGQNLELIDLIKARLPDAELAFVSACHGAAGDIEGTPDEVIHLAAALQFCGFRSVVGTLWAMADEDGPDVAEDFYCYVFRKPGRVDIRDAATALNLATKAMRKRKGMTLGRWVNFIHIGA